MITPNVLVIPCYNEEHRLVVDMVHTLLVLRHITVLFVDDGSTDGTAELLARLEQEGQGYIHVFTMEKNSGKAEAVRAGFQWAFEHGARRVGYTDADFATPPGELLRLLDALESQGLGAVLGCRIARLGAHIERDTKRHITSRIFAILASTCMRVTVYDTQCGAKWFRANDALKQAIAEPFEAKWAFDVELLGRLLGRWGNGPRLDDDDVLEIPIRAWRDVGGSKVSLKGMARALLDMAKMAVTSQRLGAAHTATLERVPIEYELARPKVSWLPSEAPAANDTDAEVGPLSARDVLSVAPAANKVANDVVDYPLSKLAAAANVKSRG